MADATDVTTAAERRAPNDGPVRTREEFDDRQYILTALEEHKRRGVELAVWARWIMLPIVAVFLIVVNPVWSQIYYVALLGLMCLNGWLMRRVARVERSRAELSLILVDILVMTFGVVVPNPFDPQPIPVPMLFYYGNFIYFFMILSAGTMAYSWRTVIAIGVLVVTTWLAASYGVARLAPANAEMSSALAALVGPDSHMWELMNPYEVNFQLRIQEAMVFLLVAGTLALSAKRFNELLLTAAGAERERANLSRYFSPNVVEQLSQNDEPLKQVRGAKVAVMFLDIKGFTPLTEDQAPHDVIDLLRGFHGRMETEVFRHNGTLDKYLGDGLMATFGTPQPGEQDATDALACARAMQTVLEVWNRDRRRKGLPALRVGIGLHYGEVVLGDIGANRLEYAVLGAAVNVASRLENLTRTLDRDIVLSDGLRLQLAQEGASGDLLDGFTCHEGQVIRGISEPMTVWVR